MDNIEKLDLIRERFNVSYKKAKEVLTETNGDVVEALIKLEESGTESQKNKKSEHQTSNDNIYKVKGQELIEKIKKNN